MVRRQREKTEVMVIGDKTSVIVMSSDGSYEMCGKFCWVIWDTGHGWCTLDDGRWTINSSRMSSTSWTQRCQINVNLEERLVIVFILSPWDKWLMIKWTEVFVGYWIHIGHLLGNEHFGVVLSNKIRFLMKIRFFYYYFVIHRGILVVVLW